MYVKFSVYKFLRDLQYFYFVFQATTPKVRNLCSRLPFHQILLIKRLLTRVFVLILRFFVNIFKGLLLSQQRFHHRCSTGLYIGHRKYWNFQSEANIQQIIAIVATCRVSCFNWNLFYIIRIYAHIISYFKLYRLVDIQWDSTTLHPTKKNFFAF